jgi:hypothetical protein
MLVVVGSFTPVTAINEEPTTTNIDMLLLLWLSTRNQRLLILICYSCYRYQRGTNDY